MREFFKPWVGSKYKSQNPKVLILGESIPIPDADQNWILNHINGIIDEKYNDGFQTRIQDIISIPDDYVENDNEYILDKKKFYERIVFQEYIQEPLSKTRERPSQAQWNQGKDFFKYLIKKYQPDIVLCTGKELYNHLPCDGNEYKTRIKYKYRQMNIWVYNYVNKNSYVCCIAHPSSFGFKKDIWSKLYELFSISIFDGKC